VSEWSVSTLGDLCHKITDGAHHSPKEDANGLPMFSVKDMKEQGFDYSKPKKINSNDFNKLIASGCQPSIGDILIAKDGSVMKHVFSVKTQPDYVLLSSIAIVKPDCKKIDSKFLVYAIKSPEVTDTILNNFVSGSGVPRIVLKDFKKVEISYPNLEQQKAIASVLSSFDDKIDLLHRQNTTLERMAETLFRQWFVEEAQKDWEEGTLSDVSDNIRQSVQAKDIQATTKYIGLEHIDRRIIALKQYGVGEDVSSNKYAFEKNDILFGKLRPYFHKVCFSPFSGICSTDILVIRPKSPDYFALCLFAYFQNDVVEYANLGSGGTRMPRTDWETLKQYPISLPDKNILLKFNAIVLPSINKITENLAQIHTLEKLRDNLLPKLMSGEIRINDD
jgi:type I restriction enzyme S subunit